MTNAKKKDILYSVQYMRHSSADSLKSEIRRLMHSQPENISYLVDISIEQEYLKVKFSQVTDTADELKISH